VNVTSWSNADIFLEAYSDRFDAVGFQELCRTEEAIEFAVNRAHKHGFHAHLHPSVSTQKGGLSSGVGLVSHYVRSFSELALDPIVVMPPPERFILKLWHGVVDSGIPWANVYLHTGKAPRIAMPSY
jgi:hypothetical protein